MPSGQVYCEGLHIQGPQWGGVDGLLFLDSLWVTKCSVEPFCFLASPVHVWDAWSLFLCSQIIKCHKKETPLWRGLLSTARQSSRH